jgi:amino acid adenylation domain-containing protein
MADLHQRVANLSLEKRALLEWRLLQRSTPRDRVEAIPRRTTAGPCRLSFAQQRLWFLAQLEPESPHYNEPKAVRLRGALNVMALQRALDALVARHEVLRTTFVAEDGQPLQVIAERRSVELPVHDLRAWPQPTRETEVQRRLQAAIQRLFDLSRDVMLRALVLRLDDEDYVLLLVTHHIASDGWSTGILWRDLSALYADGAAGRASGLPDLPIQYADYALWQRQWLQGEMLDAQLAYWKRQLDGVPTVLELPTDRPRPALQTYHGARQSFMLPSSLSEALNALSRREGATLFMTLLAAFQALLHRYTGQDDIVVGSPTAGRTRNETEGLIGFFVNTLVLRTDFSGNPTFRELLAQVREVALEAYAHQDVPLEKLVEELRLERDMSRNPLFQALFALQNVPRQPFEAEGLTMSPIEVDSATAKFDLSLSMSEQGGALKGVLEYNTDLFDTSTIRRLLSHFQTLLEGIVAAPDRAISQLPLLTAAECHHLLVACNQTRTDYPAEACLHEVFEAQVARTPDAVAVVYEAQQLTYRELNDRANHLARQLRHLGVGPEVPVGVCVARSPEMLVGLLGILKAGGAYVPLDPTYPQERLAFMVEDTQAPVLLTQTRFVPHLPEHKARIVCLDTAWETIIDAAQADAENLVSGATAENLAYVMYTSGSTGRPKAVAMSHRSLTNLLSWQLQNLTVPRGAKTLQFTSLSFDVSFQEIFSTWCSGGALVLVSEELRRDVGGLLHLLTDEAVERVFLPFVALHQLAQIAEGDGPTPAKLREMITAGEQLQITQPIANLFRKLQGCTLCNQYGPSESHVVTAFTLKGLPTAWPTLPPIGHPIANTQIYLLDRDLQPVPVGIPGELYIGGAGLARGYLNHPDLTAERFIPTPFGDQLGSRLYKTGDLARYRPDGTIEFLGRLDHQVKIRGIRIELGEIEAVLGQHPAVREAVVVAQGDHLEDKRLVAYVVPALGGSPSSAELLRFLRAKLPEYMVPSAYVVLDTLPLTPNGKVDRRRLPAPDRVRPIPEGTFVPPRNAVEQVLAGIWAEILQLEQVGVHDNFFELGGHSLLATQVIARLRHAFQVDLPLRLLFEHPSIEALAVTIEETLMAEIEQLTEDARSAS